jgi:hypothetical protein
MLESILGKKILVRWTPTSGGAAGEFIVKGVSPNIQWICLHSINETGETTGNPTWARLSDIDQIEIMDENYNPLKQTEVIKGLQVPVALTNDSISGIRASLHFELPKAEQDFYIATRAPNAFMVLISMGERLKKDAKNPKRYESADAAVKELQDFFHISLKQADINLNY